MSLFELTITDVNKNILKLLCIHWGVYVGFHVK